MTGPRILSLFSGYGGLDLAVQAVLGGEIIAHAEIEPAACRILEHRFPGIPNLGDVSLVDWSTLGRVDVVVGGFPCQDVSAAGKRLGLRPDTRSGLWTQMSYAVDQLRPELVVIENVRGLLSAAAHSDLEPCPWCVGDGGGVPLRALGAVLGDLADIGYDASWQGLRAADVGAPHGRFRVFVAAWPAADADGRGHLGTTGAGRPERVGGVESGAGGSRDSNRAGDVADRDPSAQDADLAARRERRLAAPGQAQGGRTRADAGGRDRAPAAHAGSLGWGAGFADLRPGESDAGRGAAPDTDRDGLGRLEELHGVPRTGREGPGDGNDADGLAVAAGGLDWGAYTAAVRRWERLTRPAPNPTERGKNGQPRLSPAFVEWMMGLPPGWVMDVPGLSRNEQLKALGNGVVPQQAAHALALLLTDFAVTEVPS